MTARIQDEFAALAEKGQRYEEVDGGYTKAEVDVKVTDVTVTDQSATLQLTEHTRLHLPFTPQEPDDGTPVHRPGGLLRYLLQDVPPVPVPSSAPATERPAPAGPSSRVAALRECEGDHVQATLFRPVGNETLCRRCLTPPSRKAIPCGLAATAPTSHDIGQGTARKQEERGSVYALLAHMPHRVDVEDN
jgi:hypothetical protein